MQKSHSHARDVAAWHRKWQGIKQPVITWHRSQEKQMKSLAWAMPLDIGAKQQWAIKWAASNQRRWVG